jgi:polygalacturonase
MMNLKNTLTLPLLMALLLWAGFGSAYAKERRYVISDYQAVGDSSTVNTLAIQAIIDQCAAEGGGVVVVPKGIFLTGALFFKQGVNLYLEEGAVLRGTTRQEDYPQIQTRWEGTEREWTSAMINFIDCEGVTVSGKGTINGSGDLWVAQAARQTVRPAVYVGRPRLICFQNCRNVTIRDITLRNQAVWCLHILYSSKVKVLNLNITAPHNIPSSDGIDIDSSRDVLVSGCSIDVNDDCISIKAGKDADGIRVNRPSEHILIKNCFFGYGHGGVAMGSETSGSIRNVMIRDCIVDAGNWAPIRFKTQPSRSGVVEKVTFKNIEIRDASQAFEFQMEWRMINVLPPAEILPVFRDITLINVSGKATSAGIIHGLKDSPVRNVTFKKCVLTATKGLIIENAENIRTDGLKLTVENGEPFIRR